MSERFFITTPPVAGRAELVGDEARHLAKVLRAKPGDAVTVFDGSGRSWEARVAALGRGEVALEVGEPRDSPPARSPAITLAVALPKGERQKWLIEKLTELGVATLVPLVTARGVAEATAAAIERLERGVIEACKQCGRDRLLAIGEPATVAELVAATPAGAVGIVTDPAGGSLEQVPWRPAEEVIGLVGPEGGFTDRELATAAAAGWPRVALGPYVLRIETAAVALAARLAS
jgi:16S rRNA (uracil1498-N3)-methyltransferase